MDSLLFPIDPKFFEITYAEKLLMDVRLEYWHSHVFSLPWYILTVPSILFLIIWWNVVDKKRLVEIALYGLMIALIASSLDEAGSMLSLWEYPYKVDPLFPRLVTTDLVFLPVFYMLIYQRYTDWKSFFWASLIQALVFSFILEPMLVKISLYVLLKWSHAYSVLPYLLMSVLCKWLINIFLQLQEKSRIS